MSCTTRRTPTALLSLVSMTALGAVCTTAGCAADDGVGADSANSMETHAKIVDNVPPEALVEGVFDPTVRVYGYVVDAKAGAEIRIDLLKALAGSEMGQRAGAPLDTVMRVNGPFQNVKDPGPLLAESEDGPDGSLPAPPVDLTIEKDGRYLISFSSWENTGTGEYQLKLSCEGTELQCNRSEHSKPCDSEHGPLFVQGNTIVGDPVWNQCEVVLLEKATLPAEHTLTIRPGVTVRSNYLNQRNGDRYGDVALAVEGTLRATGTEEHPVVFTSLTDDYGWQGLQLQGPSHTLSHVVIERALLPVLLGDGVAATIEDTLLQGAEFANSRTTTGIDAPNNNAVTLTGSVITNFFVGLQLRNADEFVVRDSVIASNRLGVRVDGQDPSDGHCPSSVPAYERHYDPVFEHVDIVDNEAMGIFISGSDLLVQVSKSNLLDNGHHALLVQGRALHPESFLRDSNIVDNNGTAADVATFHTQDGGALDISYNYWRDVSDPALSAHFGSYCGGPLDFSGFSPTPIADAGARADLMTTELSSYARQAR